MRTLIVAANGDALSRAAQMQAPRVVLHGAASLACAWAVLQAGPRIDSMLIDVASDVGRSRHVVGAKCPAAIGAEAAWR